MSEKLPFIHLRTHSAFSMAESTIRLKDLVKLCKDHHMPAVAITDTANMFGCLEFSMMAAKAGLQPIVGVQLRIASEMAQEAGRAARSNFDFLPLIAQNEAGYMNLMALVSQSYDCQETYGEAAVPLSALAGRTEGVIGLTGGPTGLLNRLLVEGQRQEAEAHLDALQSLFGDRLYIELQRHGLPGEQTAETQLLALADARDLPLVATNDAQFDLPERHEAHEVLLCIAQGTTLADPNRRTVTREHWFKDGTAMRRLFADIPEAIENTANIARRCSFMPWERDPILPAYNAVANITDENEDQTLRRMSLEGLEKRLAIKRFGNDAAYSERLEFELATIERMGYAGYFLIVADFIRFAKEHGIPVGPSRGSGGGSLIAYAMYITEMDPLEHNLLFERFLNPDRISMPDFDVDFCQDRREEVIEYVRDRYGADRVAQIITFGKLQARAVLRDVGRVLSMPYGQVDRICKMVPNNPTDPKTLQQALDEDAEFRRLRREDAEVGRLVNLALQLEGLFRHASTHAAGVVIGDRPLQELVPLYRDPRSDMAITQFDMRWVETAGLVKFDFLGLKTLTVIEEALKFIEQTTGERLDIDTIDYSDPPTYEMLSRAEAVGVFQLESSGMRDILRRLKPTCIEDIIATVALYRPGPMQDIPKFISRKSGDEEITFDHATLAPILEETYGVFVYQEQVMRASREMGGFTPGEADTLRKVMGKKQMDKMPAQKAKFIEGANSKNGIAKQLADDIFEKMATFGQYGFNKAHSAGYGVVAYQTAFLKANYPVEFMAANMILDSGNTDKLAILKQECDRMGIKILPPDINHAQSRFSVELLEGSLDGKAVRYALSAVKNVGKAATDSVVAERKAKGLFADLTDFAQRVDPKSVNKRLVENLASAGAFDVIHPNRHQIVASAEKVMRYAAAAVAARESSQVSLFGEPGKIDLPPIDVAMVEEWDPLEQLRAEFAAIGFYLSAHPIESYGVHLKRLGVTPLSEINALGGSKRPKIAGIVGAKQERTSKSGSRFAFLTLTDQSGSAEIAVFAELFTEHRDLFRVGEALLLTVEPRGQGDDTLWIAATIEPLEQKVSTLGAVFELLVDLPDHLPKVAELLRDGGEGPNKVKLLLSLDNGSDVEIAVPGSFAFPLKVQQAVRSLPGIKVLNA